MDFVSAFKEKKAEIALNMQRSNFRTDVTRRLRYYNLLKDYLNSPGASTAEAFFSWYPEQLDIRMEKSPFLVRQYFNLTKSKNDASVRAFMLDGWSRNSAGEGLLSILRDWVPDDEVRVLAASTSSDITKSLDILIDMCQDKINNAKQITSALSSNAPIIIISALLHYIIYSMLYTSFVSPMVFDTPESQLTPIEKNYLVYYWIGQPLNALLTLLVIVAIVVGLRWSIRNWSERLVALREEFFDFIPPWSLSRINQQYQVLTVINNFLESGSSFMEALEQAKKGASPYVQRQIDKIMANSSIPPHEAINTLFFGEMGHVIRERGSHINLSSAISTLVPKLREMKKASFDRTISIMTTVTIRPLVFLSLAWSLWPVISYFATLLSGMQAA